MKNTVLMLALMTATAGAMAATPITRETVSPNLPQHVDNTQSGYAANVKADEPQTVLQQIMQRRSGH